MITNDMAMKVPQTRVPTIPHLGKELSETLTNLPFKISIYHLIVRLVSLKNVNFLRPYLSRY